MNKKLWLTTAAAVVSIALAYFFLFNQKAEDQAPEFSVKTVQQASELYEVDIKYPQFNGLKKLNDSIYSLVYNKLSETLDEGSDRLPLVFMVDWDSSQISPEYVSFSLHFYSFLGGAHGINEIYAFNYDIKEDKEISLTEFLNNSQESLTTLSLLAKQQVIEQLEANDWETDGFTGEMITEGTQPVWENYQHFNFTPDSLIVFFQQYQVAPGAVGEIIVNIDKKELQSKYFNN